MNETASKDAYIAPGVVPSGGVAEVGVVPGSVVVEALPLPEFQHSEPCPDQIWPLMLIHTAVVVVAAVVLISAVLFILRVSIYGVQCTVYIV